MANLKSLPVIVQRLNTAHPDARYELNFADPLQLLVATILAAQCTDEKVNATTPALFARYPDARAYAEADLPEMEELLKGISFNRMKAQTIKDACAILIERFDGQVPRTMDELTTLPRVARKTANVVLNNAFRLPTGIIVDTHVARVSRRMGLTTQKKPDRIEAELMAAVSRDEWIQFGPAMVLFGRYTCTHHNPQCESCVMNDLCPKLIEAEEDEEAPETPTPADRAMPTKKPSKTKAPAKEKPATRAAAPTGIPSLRDQLPPDWRETLAAEFDKPYFKALEKFVATERANQQVFPPAEDVFNAFRATPFKKVKVLLLGQDPYHDDGQAHGMCFSVRPRVKTPPSLVNIFKELRDDLGCPIPAHGYLASWADRGVLLLNAVLTVRAHEAASHKEKGWEKFTDAVIKALNARDEPVVFLLWGAYAQKKQELIDATKHRVLTAAHPSPLSSKKFFGSKPFSGANKALKQLGQEPIDWALPADSDAKLAQTAAPTAAITPAAAATVASKPMPPPASGATSAPPKPTAPATTPSGPKGLPDDWRRALAAEFSKPYFRQLEEFIAAERRATSVNPPEEDVYAAFRLTPLDQVRVVLVGDAPPAEEGHADGLAYSVADDVPPTVAQLNMFHELRDDLGLWMPGTGSLAAWARQGVLLLNTVLTVRTNRPNSHREKGWETFADAVLRIVNSKKDPVVFLLWGPVGQRKLGQIDATRHVVLSGPHPGDDRFRGTRPFSTANDALELRGRSAVYWQLFAG